MGRIGFVARLRVLGSRRPRGAECYGVTGVGATAPPRCTRRLGAAMQPRVDHALLASSLLVQLFLNPRNVSPHLDPDCASAHYVFGTFRVAD
jgi:hypothetical protein